VKLLHRITDSLAADVLLLLLLIAAVIALGHYRSTGGTL